jgi:2',3'-cyclic-nucleotide 2'-phosphodiesterase/3'-nucleotidase
MKIKLKSFSALILFILPVLFSCSGGGVKRITILETTDVHGVVLPYDFVEGEKLDASLAGISSYLKKNRKKDNPLILLDNGDNLQGQPEEYYYNFIDTISPHFNSEVMNYLAYDAGTAGNHDIETGHRVYDRIRREYRFPILAANAVDIKSGKPYFEPYTIIRKNGLKIAVFGLITPAVPTWLPTELYSGLELRDMVETAKQWMPIIIYEKPDLVIGLFHSGWNKSNNKMNSDDSPEENGSAAVAYKVPGFDVIFNGHDHSTINEKFVNSSGDTVLILDGGSRSEKIVRADITFPTRTINGRRSLKTSGSIISTKDYPSDREFMDRFSGQNGIIRSYVKKVIGESESLISSRDAYFGSSAFVDMIHTVQLEITGADISFAAPLSFDVSISKGPVTVGDMFKLYRFENLLYTINMTGTEVQKYLEYSYGGWVNTMMGPNDLLLKFRLARDGKPILVGGRARLNNQSYNFDSAAGIDYTVDVSKPEGSRIRIKSFSDGRPFVPDKTYKVAVNSYRGSGGGGHFGEGAGLSPRELRSRLISSTDKDLRYYIMKYIENKKVIEPEPLDNWKLIPEKWVKVAAIHDYLLLFGRRK